jgi:succinate-acetate transporter protein
MSAIADRSKPGTNGTTATQPELALGVSAPALANPAALGLAGFALTTFLLSMVNANFVNKGVEPIVFGPALAFGGIAQLLAGMWEYRAGNTFGATAFSSFGAFWLSFWALAQFYLKDIPAAQVGNAKGLFLIAWALFTGLMFIASFRTTRAVNAVFGLLFVTFMLLGIGNAGAHTTMIHWGGYFGLMTAAVAGYTACAVVTNDTFGRTVLPVGQL